MTVNILAFGEYHQVIHVISLLDTSFAQSCSTSFQHNKVKTIKKKKNNKRTTPFFHKTEQAIFDLFFLHLFDSNSQI